MQVHWSEYQFISYFLLWALSSLASFKGRIRTCQRYLQIRRKNIVKLEKKLAKLKNKGKDTSKVVAQIRIEKLRIATVTKGFNIHLKYRKALVDQKGETRRTLKAKYRKELQDIRVQYEDQYDKIRGETGEKGKWSPSLGPHPN